MLTGTTIKSFDPIVDDDCTKMILGTMPGVASLDKQEYYGHSDNTFWDIIARVFDTTHNEDTVENISYKDKATLLLKNNIALWDVLQYCDRKGSLDNAIKNEIKNDFKDFLTQHPKIKTIIFNGQKAEKYFDSCFKQLTELYGLTLKTLPSTSPSHTLNTFKKLKEWRQVLSAE